MLRMAAMQKAMCSAGMPRILARPGGRSARLTAPRAKACPSFLRWGNRARPRRWTCPGFTREQAVREAGHLIAGEQGRVERGGARHSGVIGVRENGVGSSLRGGRARATTPRRRRGGLRWGDAPDWATARNRNRGRSAVRPQEIFIGGGFAGVEGAHAGPRPRRGVLAQIFVGGVFAEQGPGGVAGDHEGCRSRGLSSCLLVFLSSSSPQLFRRYASAISALRVFDFRLIRFGVVPRRVRRCVTFLLRGLK